MSKLHVEMWPSTKIPYAYLEANYAMKESGSLGNSCMRHKHMQRALQFYVRNDIKILVVIDEHNKIYARALYWENVRVAKSTKITNYLDRIYDANGEANTLMLQYLKENLHDCLSYHNNSKNLRKNLKDLDNIFYFPYTDTFRYLYIKGKTVYSNNYYVRHEHITLTHTQNRGYFHYLDPNAIKEVFTVNYINKKDGVFVKKYDGYVDKDNIIDVDGEYFSVMDTAYIYHDSQNDTYYHKKFAITEALTESKINKQKATYSDVYKGYVANYNVVISHGKVYSIYDKDVIEIDNKRYHKSDCMYSLYSTKYILKSNAIRVYTLKQNPYDTSIIDFDKEHYIDSTDETISYFELNDGTCVLEKYIDENKETFNYKKMCCHYNKKYYLPQDMSDIKYDKKQLLLFKV